MIEEYRGRGTEYIYNNERHVSYEKLKPVKIRLNLTNVKIDSYIFIKCEELISEIIRRTDRYRCKIMLSYGNNTDFDLKFWSKYGIFTPVTLYNLILNQSKKRHFNVTKVNRALSFCIVIHYLGTNVRTRDDMDSFIFEESKPHKIPFYSFKAEIVYKTFLHRYRFNELLIRFSKIFSTPNDIGSYSLVNNTAEVIQDSIIVNSNLDNCIWN